MQESPLLAVMWLRWLQGQSGVPRIQSGLDRSWPGCWILFPPPLDSSTLHYRWNGSHPLPLVDDHIVQEDGFMMCTGLESYLLRSLGWGLTSWEFERLEQLDLNILAKHAQQLKTDKQFTPGTRELFLGDRMYSEKSEMFSELPVCFSFSLASHISYLACLPGSVGNRGQQSLLEKDLLALILPFSMDYLYPLVSLSPSVMRGEPQILGMQKQDRGWNICISCSRFHFKFSRGKPV